MKQKLTALFLAILMIFCVFTPMTAALPVASLGGAETPGTISWPLGQALPSFSVPAGELDAISIRSLPFPCQVAMMTLQGIVNRAQPRILIFDNAGEGLDTWPQTQGLNYAVTTDWQSMILKYIDELNGLAVFNTAVIETVNVATTAAGLFDCLAVSPELADILQAAPFNLPVVTDLNKAPITNKAEAYNYLYQEYWPLCTRRAIFGLAPDGHLPLRDLAVAVKGAVFWLNPGVKEDKDIIDKFFGDATPIDTCFAGWWPDEGEGIGYASRYGVSTVPSDFFENSTVYSGLSRKLTVPAVPAKPELQYDKIYVTLNYSDGDNIQYNQHAMRMGRLWGNPRRGEAPVGWTCSPALLDAAPQILNYYYQSATENDVLICGPSGVGYTHAGQWKDAAMIAKYAAFTNSYFERTGFNIITNWGLLLKHDANIFTGNFPALLGMTVQHKIFSRIFYTGTDVPVIWFGIDLPDGGAMSYDTGTENVRRRLTQVLESNPRGPQFYAAQFDAWMTPVNEIADMVTELHAQYPGRFEFVRTDHFMMLLREADGKPFEVSLQKEAAASSGEGASKAFDGTFSTGWQAAGAGESWLQVDLGKTYLLDRYVLKNAETNYLDGSLNTRAWKIQVSENGADGWRLIDSQNGNTDAIVYRNLPAVKARYVRILVTDAGADGIARIQEFAVYGTDKNAGKTFADRVKDMPGDFVQFFRNLWNAVKMLFENTWLLVRLGSRLCVFSF